ncbi:MAG: T9SS type A sorting domain-containing protein [Candidatus Zophobacter franzmannii]|nr:T9SS type A sorting domain-containing protein [Candidatus Zophobacter franzmannii]
MVESESNPLTDESKYLPPLLPAIFNSKYKGYAYFVNRNRPFGTASYSGITEHIYATLVGKDILVMDINRHEQTGDETSSIHFDVTEDMRDLEVILSWDKDNSSYNLYVWGPDNSYEADHLLSNDETMKRVFIRDPKPGKWRMKAHCTALNYYLDNEGNNTPVPDYPALTAMAYTKFQYHTGLSLIEGYKDSQSYLLTTSFHEQDSLVDSAYVYVECENNNGIEVIQLYDDGLHNDDLANDGLFANMYDANVTGPNKFRYYALKGTQAQLFDYRSMNVVFEAETIPRVFSKEWNWIGLPKLNRTTNSIVPTWYVAEQLKPDFGKIVHENTSYVYVDYEYVDYGLTYLNSYDGYKLFLDTINSSVSFYEEGDLIPEDTEITLTANDPQWVCYFLEDSIMADVALENILSNLKSVKHQEWFAYRENLGDAWKGGVPQSCWEALKYGQMVELTSFVDTTFVWNPNAKNGGKVQIIEKPNTGYFEYSELEDYAPIYVDVSGQNFAEIGAYIGEICKGYGVVVNDTAKVQVYLTEEDVASGQQLSFYGITNAKDKCSKQIGYSVWNKNENTYINKPLMSFVVKNSEYYMVKGHLDDVTPVYTYSLSNYPNPFNPDTSISYSVKKDEKVKIQIYNIRGQRIKTIVNEKHEPGNYVIVWNGKDDNNKSISSGVYFMRMSTPSKKLTNKIMMLK